MTTCTLTTLAIEQSTFAVDVSFFDEDGTAVSPDVGTLTWSLFNWTGTVVNSRTDVAITSAETVTIVLSGDDLDLDDGKTRKLLVSGTYTGTLGNNLPLNAQTEFEIRDLVGVS